MDEDQILQSIIADPQLTDPSIDVGQLRQTTPTRTELLADVPEFSGLKFDPTQRSYVEDLYALYGGGAPMLPEPVVDTPVVDTTPIVDTSAMDKPAGDSVLDTTPTNTQFEQNLLDQGIGVQGAVGDPVVAPGEMLLTQDDFDDFNKIAVTPQSGITGDPIDVGIPDNESGFVDPLGTMGGAPVVSQQLQDQGPTTGTISDDRLNEVIGGQPMAAGPFDYLQEQTPISQVTVGTGLSQTEKDKLAGYKPSFETPEQQDGFLQNVLGRAGQTVEGALNELGKIPGAIVDFTNQTVDVFGKKLNVGKTLASAAINKLAGGPISLVFDAIGALGLEGGPTLQTEKADSIGLLSSDTTSGYKDKYGINTQSAFGDYDQYNIDRVEELEDIVADQKNRGLTDTIQMKELEDRKEYNKISGVGGDIDDDPTGDAEIAEIIAQQEKNQIQPTDPDLEITDRGRGDDGGQDTTDTDPADDFEVSGDVANVGTAMDLIGPAPAPAPAYDFDDPTPAPAPVTGTTKPGTSGGGGPSGGGKSIVCTAMYQTTGLEDWKKAMKIWYIYQKKYLTIQHQEGYHKLFKPFVKGMHKSKIIKAIGAHIAKHRTQHLKHIMFDSKPSLLGKIYNKILEPICYWVGKHD